MTAKSLRIGLAVACAVLWAAGAAAPAQAEEGLAPFAIEVGGQTVPYENFFTSVPPGGVVIVALPEDAAENAYFLVAPDRAIAFLEGAAHWTAPDAPGESRTLRIARTDGAEIHLQVFIEQPMSRLDENGELNGYTIGAYPTQPLRGLETYAVPTGFIEVTPDTVDMKVSPHFTLGQFLCKQQENHWPKYVLLDEALVLKLEALLADVNAQGIAADTLFVMSGYRTPWYNRAIGNTTTYSQHVFGGAADVFVDVAPHNGEMDDLNGDGRVTVADAAWLMQRAVQVEQAYVHLVGGLGQYDRNAAHGPFVHVDSRGYEARW